MNAKEISDSTLPAVTPADNDLMLIYDTSEGTTGKATIAGIAPKVAENIDIATLPAVTSADDDVLMIRDTSKGMTGKATIADIISSVGGTSKITESSALANIGTSANATQHAVNVAIDSALGGESLSPTFASHVKGSAIKIGKLVIVTIETESGFSIQAYDALVSGLPSCANYTYNTITKADGSLPKNLYITSSGTFIGSIEAMNGSFYRGQLIYVCN